jgi:hypothetical protein
LLKKLGLFLASIAPGIFLIGYNTGMGSKKYLKRYWPFAACDSKATIRMSWKDQRMFMFPAFPGMAFIER